VIVLPFSKFQKYFYFLRHLHQKFPDGIVCTDDNYSCQYDITQKKKIVTQSRTGLQIYEGHDDQLIYYYSNSYIILICVMCLWPGLVVDTRYK
jgi:hypothetical protein